jgi:hypothetical protein
MTGMKALSLTRIGQDIDDGVVLTSQLKSDYQDEGTVPYLVVERKGQGGLCCEYLAAGR